VSLNLIDPGYSFTVHLVSTYTKKEGAFEQNAQTLPFRSIVDDQNLIAATANIDFDTSISAAPTGRGQFFLSSPLAANPLTAFTATAFAHIDDSATCSSTFSNRCDEITPPSLATHTLVPLCPACTIIDNASSPPPTFAL
jgi:hypothetical protein